ncbi:hypothetical protein T310_0900 [Rasamsonia emersonii CBS 393.64]|uniref:Uncharacterized protein n=1 Tax=Rasamsonia emersonii (strain ATCC 16479 / CBS 393.64 / IMI 116815) TaxID=1408163 RepID=A0A0F4Z3V8_RASE3|nr:hypothetical protein T310_0900 [Rasamsonia emersonii CBS 393.64]KKA25035.1 hypothetical protein T310_0900 [Rasamsonia emersonii CBS 393.64]
MIFSLRLDLRGVRIPFRYSATSCELTFDIGNNDNNNNPTGRQDRPKSVVTTAPVVPSPLGRRAEPPSSRLPSAANQHHCSVRFDTRTSPRNRHTSSIGVLSTDWGVYSKKTEDRPVRRYLSEQNPRSTLVICTKVKVKVKVKDDPCAQINIPRKTSEELIAPYKVRRIAEGDQVID